MKYIVANINGEATVMVRKNIGDHEVYEVYARCHDYDGAAYTADSLNAREQG